MRPLRRRRAEGYDPAPSRWGYRFQRLMLTPLFRATLRIGLPVFLTVAAVGGWLAAEDNRVWLHGQYVQLRDAIQSRPEFEVRMLAVAGADADLTEVIRETIPVDFPLSSFDLDLPALRQGVAALPAVERVTVRVRPGGVLQVDVTQRQPVAVWREAEGLHLVDATGAVIGPIESRGDRPDLPLIAGDGARSQVAEALTLYAAAEPLGPRMRGLVRMGERRWDVVLDRGQRILLPTDQPVRALERVLALSAAQDMLERDISIIDMRIAARPTIRLNPPAVAELRRVTALELD